MWHYLKGGAKTENIKAKEFRGNASLLSHGLWYASLAPEATQWIPDLNEVQHGENAKCAALSLLKSFAEMMDFFQNSHIFRPCDYQG